MQQVAKKAQLQVALSFAMQHMQTMQGLRHKDVFNLSEVESLYCHQTVKVLLFSLCPLYRRIISLKKVS